MEKVLVLGNGFVANHLPYQKYTNKLSIDDGHSFQEQVINKYKPKCIINTIGFTGRPNIDQCELEKDKTYLINTVLPIILANKCNELGIRFINISSGCIFNGTSPNYYHQLKSGDRHYMDDVYERIDDGWKETDVANPVSYYGKTKYACDLILGDLPNCLSLRIRMPISEQNTPRNFINKILNYKQIIDIPNSVTFMSDLVRGIDWFVNNDLVGIYHFTNPQPLSAARVLIEYQKYIPAHKFEVISEQQLDMLTKAKRSNCMLNTDKLRKEGFKAGFEMTNTNTALQQCMANYIKNIG